MPENLDINDCTDAIADTLHGNGFSGFPQERALLQNPIMFTPTHLQPGIGDEETRIFTNLLLNFSEEEVSKQFTRYLEQEYPVRMLFEVLLVNSAQLLGKMWVEDTCSFADVTLGLTVIHRLLHRFSNRLSEEVSAIGGAPMVFVTPVPGEAHIFAAALLTNYFCAAQWRVQSGVNEAWNVVLRRVGEYQFDVVAITVSNSEKMEEAKRLVAQIRRRSRNRHVHILVGGPPFICDPQLFRDVGADSTASDVMMALESASDAVNPEKTNVL